MSDQDDQSDGSFLMSSHIEIAHYEHLMRELLQAISEGGKPLCKRAEVALVFEAIGSAQHPPSREELHRQAARRLRDKCVALGSPLNKYADGEWSVMTPVSRRTTAISR